MLRRSAGPRFMTLTGVSLGVSSGGSMFLGHLS